MDKYIMAIDQGTTSSKAFIINRRGEIVGWGGHEFRQIYPRPGWVEHDPMEIWQTQERACRDALKNAYIEPIDIEAIGITNQRETTVLWERETGRPIANAIVWQCRRTSELCERLIRENRGDPIRKKTGLVVDAYFSATKIQWILQTVPDALEKAAKGELCFGTIDSWLVFNLTGGKVHATDPSNASRTMLFNIETCLWDREILEWLSIPEAVLPDVRDSSEIYGYTAPEVFGTAIPIGGVAGDQQAALFGQTCFEKGDIKNTYGTGCFVLANIGEKPLFSTRGLLTSVGWRLGSKATYVFEGSVFVAGAAVQWLRDGLGIIEKSGDIEALALTVPDNGGVHFLPAFAGLGTPYWDMYARGTITGITRGTHRGHLARATLESIAHQTKDVMEAIEADFGEELRELKVDGGAAENSLLMQFQADILGVPVIRPRFLQTTALGAAYLAGLATGYWSPHELRGFKQQADRFVPHMGEDERMERCRRWSRLVEMARMWGDGFRASSL
jgi:glycerol kinase